jgi:hypothetical protein
MADALLSASDPARLRLPQMAKEPVWVDAWLISHRRRFESARTVKWRRRSVVCCLLRDLVYFSFFCPPGVSGSRNALRFTGDCLEQMAYRFPPGRVEASPTEPVPVLIGASEAANASAKFRTRFPGFPVDSSARSIAQRGRGPRRAICRCSPIAPGSAGTRGVRIARL